MLLDPEIGSLLPINQIRTLLHIVPDASGDVVLAFSIVNFIKTRNPGCAIKFATLKRNIPLARMCPGIDEVIELDSDVALPLNRSRTMDHFKGTAEAIIYTLPTQENWCLLQNNNLIEAMWKLAGLSETPNGTNVRLWIEPPEPERTASVCWDRCFGIHSSLIMLKCSASKAKRAMLGVIKEKRIRTGWRDVFWPLRFVCKPSSFFAKQIDRRDRKWVVLATHAKSVPGPSVDLQRQIVRRLRKAGFSILHNVMDPAQALSGTTPLICNYQEFCALRHIGLPFVGWRNGLCDIAAAFPAPMVVLYPPKAEAYPQSLLDLFGLATMKVALNVLEIVCANADNLDSTKWLSFLESKQMR